jgi:hypothetical protein
MGSSFSSNTNSNSAEHKNFAEIMDFIATHYILTSDFKSMVRLTEKEYCDKLIVLTSGIIQRYFTDTEIQYLAQRIKNGEEVNQMNTENIFTSTETNWTNWMLPMVITKMCTKNDCALPLRSFILKLHIFFPPL